MSITKKFLNMFKSGKDGKDGEDQEARLRAQKERSDNFLRALTEGDLDARWSAVRSVGDLGEPFIEPLIGGLKDEYWIIRRGAADTLGRSSRRWTSRGTMYGRRPSVPSSSSESLP
jgi:hypothetical protein